MKKFLSVALATVAIASCCAFVGCNGGEATVNYTLSEDGTYYILSSVTGNKRALTEYEIPSTYAAEEDGEQLPVTAIADNAFYECTRLLKLTLPDSLTTIGDRSFAKCGMIKIEIPDSVESIGREAFNFCPNLERVIVPASVVSLGYGAFMNCSKLQRAEVYASITELKPYTFYNPITAMGGNVYSDSVLSKVVITDSIVKIADSALKGNPITDIYYTGTQAQWDELYFYTLTTNDKGEEEEKKLEKNTIIPSSTTIHFDYVPEK